MGDISVEEAAKLLNTSDTTIRNWITQDRQAIAAAKTDAELRAARRAERLPGVERRNDRGHKTWWIPLKAVRALLNGG